MPSLKVISLFLALSFGVALGSCPDASLLDPCTCQEHRGLSLLRVTCSNVSSEVDVQNVVDRTVDYPFPALSLVNAGLPHLSSSWLRQKRVQVLELRNSVLLTLLENENVEPLPLVTNITIEETVLLRKLLWPALGPFSHLKHLSVTGTAVGELGQKFRDNISNDLETLHLHRAKISPSLEGGPFKGKKNILIMEILESGIRTVEHSLFEDQKEKLTFINLSGNPIESLPDDIFDGFQQLMGVWLEGGKLKTLPRQLFHVHNPFLPRFYGFDRNPFVCDCSMRWVLTSWTPLAQVNGTCHTPLTLRGKRLDKLAQSDFNACDAL